MGMTMAEKILASHSGLDHVSPGEYVTAEIDVMMGNDITFADACSPTFGAWRRRENTC